MFFGAPVDSDYDPRSVEGSTLQDLEELVGFKLFHKVIMWRCMGIFHARE